MYNGWSERTTYTSCRQPIKINNLVRLSAWSKLENDRYFYFSSRKRSKGGKNPSQNYE